MFICSFILFIHNETLWARNLRPTDLTLARPEQVRPTTPLYFLSISKPAIHPSLLFHPSTNVSKAHQFFTNSSKSRYQRKTNKSQFLPKNNAHVGRLNREFFLSTSSTLTSSIKISKLTKILITLILQKKKLFFPKKSKLSCHFYYAKSYFCKTHEWNKINKIKQNNW